MRDDVQVRNRVRVRLTPRPTLPALTLTVLILIYKSCYRTTAVNTRVTCSWTADFSQNLFTLSGILCGVGSFAANAHHVPDEVDECVCNASE